MTVMQSQDECSRLFLAPTSDPKGSSSLIFTHLYLDGENK